MKTKIEIKWLLAVLGPFLILFTACSSSSPAALTTDDEVAIYSAVVRQVAGQDDTFGGTLVKPVIYILSETSDAAGDPSAAGSESRALPAEVQDGVSAALSDLPSTLIWVADRGQVALNDDGSVADGGVIITLGNIHTQESGEVHIAGSIYIGNLAAGEQTYVLEEQDGAWAITGNTGVEWIS